jgi:hypothetical protein
VPEGARIGRVNKGQGPIGKLQYELREGVFSCPWCESRCLDAYQCAGIQIDAQLSVTIGGAGRACSIASQTKHGRKAFETLNCFTCQSPYLAIIRIRQNEINRLPELDNGKMT